MRVQSDTQLITFQNWTLRVRPASTRTPRLLLLLHGWTGDENSMWVFVRNFPADFWMVAPRVPYATQPSGYSWRPLRAGVLAGFVPMGSESLVAKRPLNGQPFFVAHGTLDEMVPIEYARQSVKILERAGAQVTFCEDEVGHKVSVDCLRALEEFFE